MDWTDAFGLISGIVGALIGVLGFVYGIWARSHPKQADLWTGIEASPIGLPADEQVRVTYGEQTLTKPHLITLRVAHRGGPEVDTIEGNAIRFTASPDSSAKVLGLLNDGPEHATLQNNEVQLKPRMFKTAEEQELLLLSDGDPVMDATIRISNVTHLTEALERRRLRRAAKVAVVLLSLTMLAVVVSLVLYFLYGWVQPLIGSFVLNLATMAWMGIYGDRGQAIRENNAVLNKSFRT